MNEYFTTDEFSAEDKRDTSFNVLAGVRDALNLALKQQPPTYENALKYVEDIDPNLHKELVKYLPGKNESELVTRFKEKAKAINGDAKQLISAEIEEYRNIVTSSTEESRNLKGYIGQLRTALQHFETREDTEHKLLNHDFYIANRTNLKEVYQNSSRRDYELPNGNHFRIYLAHPDKIEHVLGADLIYEQYDLKLQLARFAHLQYKTWNGKSISLKDRDKAQLQRLHDNLCSVGFCKAPEVYKSSNIYRFPYCCAFLRPTSKLVSLSSKMRTTGIHIPLCKILSLNSENKTLSYDNLYESSISQQIFEESFNKYHIGSGWMPIGEMEEFYKKRKLTELSDNVRILAQEVLHEMDDDDEPPF